jgi:epoxyqueuosine reductase
MEEVIERLYSQLEQRGLKGRVVSIQRLQDLKQDIEGRHAQDFFDEDFYRERLSFFEFSPPSEVFTAASLIVVAMPRPQTRVNFTWNGKTLSLILPPTYLGYERISARIENLLAELLAPEGYHATLARLPLKSLAVRSGLGAYGRNNICYVPGMGSFLQLVACCSDLPCEEDDWREPAMMERCQDCQACLRKCPTQAITSERFLLHAERCIVFHNEMPADRSFPDWLDLSSHDCLLGCMYCQRFCPEDKQFLGWFEGNEEFSREETSLLLKGSSRDQLPAETVEKLERLGLLDDLGILPRNLKVLFKADRPAH